VQSVDRSLVNCTISRCLLMCAWVLNLPEELWFGYAFSNKGVDRKKAELVGPNSVDAERSRIPSESVGLMELSVSRDFDRADLALCLPLLPAASADEPDPLFCR
jgi:hypothetical protein